MHKFYSLVDYQDIKQVTLERDQLETENRRLRVNLLQFQVLILKT